MTDDLNQSLHELNIELEATETEDEKHRTLLERMRLEIQEALDPDRDNDYESLREKLEESFVEFEGQHPSLGAAIRRAVNILSLGGV